jgi:hypothetical protein
MGNSICATCMNCDSCTLPKQSQIFECEDFSDGHKVIIYEQGKVDLDYLVVHSSRAQEQPMANMK